MKTKIEYNEVHTLEEYLSDNTKRYTILKSIPRSVEFKFKNLLNKDEYLKEYNLVKSAYENASAVNIMKNDSLGLEFITGDAKTIKQYA
tara:strand:- start:581 stop:847 length:267 start_codon:yes stop_codon:yes gene_type:complete